MSSLNPLKKYCLLGIAFLSAFILTSCCCFRATDIKSDKESWLCHLNLDTNKWTCNADSWFLTGRPNQIQRANARAACDKALTKMTVKVPHFNKVVANGSFQLQIVGNERDSVSVIGSNNSARQVAVEVRDGTLYLHQPTNRLTVYDITIVRVNVRNLTRLTNLGCGNIYGRGILSNNLSIVSAGAGDIMLMGNMNLTAVKQIGRGKVVVMGANTPTLDIVVRGNGIVDICGHVGIHSIYNCGNGAINIIGADTDCLDITATGASLTTVIGTANLRKVTAIQQSRVYLYWVNSQSTTVIESDKARVGLAGKTGILTVNLSNSADFEGQYLQSDKAFARTQHYAHANISTHQQLFAESRDDSSIYYYDSPKNISDFVWGNGIVIPLQHTPCPCLPARPNPRIFSRAHA